MSTISFIKYYFSLGAAYVKYLFAFLLYKFEDFPNEVKVAALITSICILIMFYVQISLFWMSFMEKRKRKLRERIEKKWGKGMEYLVSQEASELLNEAQIADIFELDKEDPNKPLLKNNREKNM